MTQNKTARPAKPQATTTTQQSASSHEDEGAVDLDRAPGAADDGSNQSGGDQDSGIQGDVKGAAPVSGLNEGGARFDTEGSIAEQSASASGDATDAVAREDELQRLRSELESGRNEVLRAHAEMQNVRRRAEQDVERARKFALDRFVKELLPVVDSLEKAVESFAGADSVDGQAIQASREGVEMTLSMMLKALERFDVELMDPVGQPFNPEHHEAMSLVPSADVEPNSVVAVLQKGYLLNGRLVRPAMVMVSRAQ